MEIISNNFTLDLEGGFPLSTDSMLLADFVKLPKNAAVLDLGSGCGTLGLLLCARDAGCTVTGIELSEAAHAAALGNIARNGLQARLSSICADLRTMPFRPGEFQVCLANPPYFFRGRGPFPEPCRPGRGFLHTEGPLCRRCQGPALGRRFLPGPQARTAGPNLL